MADADNLYTYDEDFMCNIGTNADLNTRNTGSFSVYGIQGSKEYTDNIENENRDPYLSFERGLVASQSVQGNMDRRRQRLESTSSIVDGLLSEIYDRWHDHKHDSFDSDTFTECSSTSEFAHWRRSSCYQDLEVGGRQISYLHRGLLQEHSIGELKNLISEMTRRANHMSARLVRQLKRRERRMSKLQNNCDIVTAIIQASSPKRRIDTRMRFTVEPALGDNAFEQWKDAMKAVARLPLGIPDEFRKKVWLSLADHHIHELKIDWDKTVRFAFNEKSNPDDNKLGLQIVKDLHRTGCSGFSGEDNEEERALLKRILLAYARWNKAVGYCQGFNVIAALLLEVMDRKEADALKVMIYLIDHVLPQSYFDNNLRALSVDMAVFRDLLKIFPKLSKHLDYLQHAQDQASGGCYEPPLTNVFTMQWFLTLFATCLPKSTVLRVWDSILLDGSEILLRTALVIWGKLSSRILTVSTADEFYTLMGDITHEMLEGDILDADSMIKSIYSIAPFPFPQLNDLREKYTYNIRPFTPASKRTWTEGSALPSDEDDLEEEDIEAITCFTGFIPTNATNGAKSRVSQKVALVVYKPEPRKTPTAGSVGLDSDQRAGSVPDMSSLGPGAYGLGPSDNSGIPNVPAYMERMTTDIGALKKQYAKLRQRQTQAHIILTTASAKQHALKPTRPMVPKIETPTAVNHLFLNKQGMKGRNRFVAAGPRIANMYPVLTPAAMTNRQKKTTQPQSQQGAGDAKSKWVPKRGQKQKQTVAADAIEETTQTLPHSQSAQSSPNKSSNTSPSKTPETSPCKSSETSLSVIESSSVSYIKDAKTDDQPQISSTNRLDSESTLRDVDKSPEVKGEYVKRCNPSPTNLEDSGLGNSISSPAHSNSSADFSPSPHNSATSVSAGSGDQSGGLAGECCSENTNNLDQSISEMNAQKQVPVSVSLDQFYKNTEDVWEDSESVSGAGVENFDKVKSKKSDKEDTNDVSSHCNGANIESLNGAVEKKVTHNRNEDKISPKSDSECNDKSLSETEKSEISIENNSSKNPQLSVDVGMKIGDENVRNNAMEKKQQKAVASGSGVSTRSSSCPSSFRRSYLRSVSSTSAASSFGSECENMQDVFSPADEHRSISFQQYYNNKRNLSIDSSSSLEAQLKKCSLPKKTFNPFPVKHVNQNRAKTGIKLGLYKQSTLEEFEKNLKNQTLWGK